ncbi:hypothetical protein R1flu_010711 [Riccia fluitans]|uniref:Protein EXORDIUM-like 2 n=1 Tax=Riccia fluitans TaxID=41844 RepID=A0ABD1Z5R2_9MARC
MSVLVSALTVFLLWSVSCAPAAEGRLLRNPPLILDYHNGPLLSGDAPIKVYLTFYGEFSRYEKATLRAFLYSFNPPTPSGKQKDSDAAAARKRRRSSVPTVSQWWSLTRGYKDLFGATVSQKFELVKSTTDVSYSRGKELKKTDIYSLVVESVKKQVFPTDPKAIYLVFTAEDVVVEGFCAERCGEHGFTFPSVDTSDHMLPFAWVGNSASQCPGFCAWPFARSELLGDTPLSPVLKAPNGIGIDGMVITLAKVLAGTATDPYGNGYYQGEQSAGLEASGACTGAFGAGAYPGNPGKVRVDKLTGASYNVKGFKRWKFMVPYMWNPETLSCEGKS